MQAKERLPAAGVIHHLLDNPAQYQFRQGMRLLLMWLRSQGITYEDAFKDVLRFQNSVSLGFPASEIEALKAELTGSTGDPPDRTTGEEQEGLDWSSQPIVPGQIVLTPKFIGLLGASGTLPFHYSERIAAQQLHSKDDSARAFLDLLSNRMVGLFFESWGKYRLESSVDTQGTDSLRGLLTQLGGFKHTGSASRTRGEDDAKAYYAAAFRNRPVSAFAVADALSDHFGLPIEIEQFVGSWDELRIGQKTVLGRTGPTLGQGATMGARIWRCDLRIRLNIGPLDAAQRDRCLPHGAIASGIKRMLQHFGMTNLDCEMRLLLKPECIRPACLSANPRSRDRLGWGCFLATVPGSPKQADVRYLLKMHTASPMAATTLHAVA